MLPLDVVALSRAVTDPVIELRITSAWADSTSNQATIAIAQTLAVAQTTNANLGMVSNDGSAVVQGMQGLSKCSAREIRIPELRLRTILRRIRVALDTCKRKSHKKAIRTVVSTCVRKCKDNQGSANVRISLLAIPKRLPMIGLGKLY